MFSWARQRNRRRFDGEFAIELVRQMVVPTFVLGPDGKVMVWNQSCEALTGVSAASVVGTKEHWRGFYPEPRPCLADIVLGAADRDGAIYAKVEMNSTGDGRAKAENWCDLPNGRRCYLAIDAGAIRDHNGRIVAVVETLRDLTGEKKALEEAREAEANRERAMIDQQFVVERLAKGLLALSEGQLDMNITEFFPVQYKGLRMDFNQAMQTLSDAMLKIRDSSHRVASEASGIASGSSNLAQRAEEQAATLEETAAAHDELTKTVQKTLEESRATAKMVADAKQNATNSREIVIQAVEAIRNIQQSSGHITQIISLIDEIAFQTNLLALNAGVEAARAGDSGRGFAVVAKEVRALAQRSTQAAKEIKGLTEKSTCAVAKGVAMVELTGSNLLSIVDQVAEVADCVQRITAMAEDQAISLQEVNKAIGQLDIVTQQNANVADENASSCTGLTTEANSLAGLVERFSIKSDRGNNSVTTVGGKLRRVG